MDSRLQGRIAVVTGAAAGLGKAAAIRLAKEGASVEILDLQDGTAAVEEIRALGARPIPRFAIAPTSRRSRAQLKRSPRAGTASTSW